MLRIGTRNNIFIMDTLNMINTAVVSLGIPSVIAAAIYIGRKLQILDDLKGIRGRFDVVESRVGDLWADRLAPAHSPRQLNDRGSKVLEESGIKSVVDGKKDELLRMVKEKNPTNAYDAETAITEVMEQLPKSFPDIVPILKQGAFRVGADIDAVLFVGSIYLRNLIFKELGFTLDDLDKPKTP